MSTKTKHITRFRKNLSQFLDLKQSGKLNGKASVVEEKMKTAAEVIGLDFRDEVKKAARQNPNIKIRQIQGTDTGDDLPFNRADEAWLEKNVNVDFTVKPWHTDPEKAAAEFNLKGIEFGKWLNAKDRAEYLANTMQALHYMSRILNVSHKQMGVDGRLGIAFGARGKGGKAVAHYEPVNNVMINLTKEKGQRSLAHEYTHAIDNLAGFDLGKSFLTGGTSISKEKDFLEGSDPLTKTVNKFFNTLFWNNAEKSNYYKRMLDKTQYEQRRLEIFARCGEIYFSEQAKEKSFPTDYIGSSGFGGINPTKDEFKEAQSVLKTLYKQAYELFEGKEPAESAKEKSTQKSEKKSDKKEIKQAIGSTGAATTVDFKPDGSQSKEGRYQLIELKNLTASHNKDCSVNSKHRISKGQPRDRSLDNLCAQPKFIAKNLNPSSITQGNLAFQGAPVVTKDGMVIQGNGRSIALKIVYDEIPKNAKKYKEYLEKNAKEFGFKKSDVTGMNKPVLVRMLDVDDKEAIRLGNIVDTSQAKLSRIDQAKATIRNLTPSKLEAIGRIIAGSQGETIGAIIDDIGIRIFDQVKDLDRTGLIENGELTSDGKELLRSVLTGIIFDSEENKSALRDFLDNPHTIQAGIERSYGSIIPLIGQKGDIRNQLQEAVQITAEVKRNDAFDSVEDVTSAQDIFSGAKNLSKQGQDLARFLLDAGTQKEIRDAFRVYVAHIKGKDDLFNPVKATTQKKAFDAAFVKRENPPEHVVKLLTPADFKKGDIIRDFYEDEKFWIEKKDGKTYHVKSLETGKKETFKADDKRFLPNRPVTPTMDLFDETRKNFEISLEPKQDTKATGRFLREGTDFEKAVVRAMVNDENFKTFVNELPKEKHQGFYENLAWRLSLFTGPNDEPLWFSFIDKPLGDFAKAIKKEAKKMFKADSNNKGLQPLAKRQNPNRTDIRLVKPKYQFPSEAEAWETVQLTTGFTREQVKPKHTEKAWIWVRKNGRRETADGRRQNAKVKSETVSRPKSDFKTARSAWSSISEDTGLRPAQVRPDHTDTKWRWKIVKRQNQNPATSNQQPATRNRPDIRLVKPKKQFSTVDEAWESVHEATGLFPIQVQPAHTDKSWRWIRIDEPRQNPKARFVMLGISKELVIDQGESGMKTVTLPMAMFTNKKKDKLFLAPFSELRELDFDIKDKAAEEVFKMWHNFPADQKDFEVQWPDIPAGPIGFGHSILYASDKVMREWDEKGKMNLYEHDFDPGKRPAFRKGKILIIANLEINERGILN